MDERGGASGQHEDVRTVTKQEHGGRAGEEARRFTV